MNNNELILFESQDKTVVLPVQMKDETVWLNQAQMTELFSTTKQNVSLHANNCFKEGELDKNSVVKDFLTTASDGKKYKTKYYNLDVIISVGYRVKSQRGVEFRKWANKVLKDYIVHEYAINQKRLRKPPVFNVFKPAGLFKSGLRHFQRRLSQGSLLFGIMHIS